MPLHLIDHPLAAHRLVELRASATKPDRFRALVAELGGMLAYEATRQLATEPTTTTTPMGTAEGRRLTGPDPLVVPVLRAGLSMLDAALGIIPTAEVALIGLRRDEDTLQPALYCDTVPLQLGGRDVFVLDPMLATGGSAAFACAHVIGRGAGRTHAVCIVAAPEGVARLARECPEVTVWAATLDPGLDASGYIVPGLGDAGDRLYGMLAP
jgi:uracil phosphoribosyltransferase